MKKRVGFIGSVLTGATIIAVGLGMGVGPAQAIPTGNNGNNNGQSGQNFQDSGNAQNGNNGNHNGWYKNENGQYSQNTTYSINTTTNSNSVPGPDTLILLGAGLSGLVTWRRMSRKA